jgi:hypothetical protein
MGHHLSNGNYFFLFGQKYGNVGNIIYTFGSMWLVFVNVTLRGIHTHTHTHTQRKGMHVPFTLHHHVDDLVLT